MMKRSKPSLLYRLQYAWHFRKQTASTWRHAWEAANAFDLDDIDDQCPRDAVIDELDAWDNDGDQYGH